MTALPIKYVAILSMAALLIFYLASNSLKLTRTFEALEQISQGEASTKCILKEDGVALVRRLFPPKGIFDHSGHVQIDVSELPNTLFEYIQKHIDHISLVCNDSEDAGRFTASGKFLTAVGADRRLYFVREGDAETIASICWFERRQAQDVVVCNGNVLCPGVRVEFGVGWEGLMGPFLKSDFVKKRRGLSRGRWILGPETRFRVFSDRPRAVTLDLIMLGVSADQEFSLVGGNADVQKKIVQRSAAEYRGGDLMYPVQLHFRVQLGKGENEFILTASRWRTTYGPNLGRAAYVKALNISD